MLTCGVETKVVWLNVVHSYVCLGRPVVNPLEWLIAAWRMCQYQLELGAVLLLSLRLTCLSHFFMLMCVVCIDVEAALWVLHVVVLWYSEVCIVDRRWLMNLRLHWTTTMHCLRSVLHSRCLLFNCRCLLPSNVSLDWHKHWSLLRRVFYFIWYVEFYARFLWLYLK